MKLELCSLRARGCGPLREDTLIDFTGATGRPRPVTVLGGANGSGKTTVLELVVALCETLHPTYKRSHNILERAEYVQLDWLVDDIQPFSIFYGHSPTDAKLPDEYFGWHIHGQEQPRRASQGGLAEKIAGMIHRQEARALDFAFADVQQALAESGDQALLPSILYLPHFRSLPSVKGEQIERAETQYQWIYRYRVALTFRGSLDSYLIWLDYAEPETFRRVCDFLNGLDFDGKTFGVHRRALKAVVKTRDGHTHDVELLSSGEQNILITLLELRRRLVPHSLVLIDEIENSLHPAFQHRIAQGLRWLQESVPFQLIITTHAPAFVKIFGAESTLILTEF